MESKIINNNIELIKRDDQIYIYKALPKCNIDLETMEQMIKTGDEWNGTKLCANLIDIREVGIIDSKARVCGAEQFQAHVAGLAVLIDSKISSYFANLFLKFSKSKVPIKLFTTEKKAIEWLKEKMQMRN